MITNFTLSFGYHYICQNRGRLSVITPNELSLIKFDKNPVKLSHFLGTNTIMLTIKHTYICDG